MARVPYLDPATAPDVVAELATLPPLHHAPVDSGALRIDPDPPDTLLRRR